MLQLPANSLSDGIQYVDVAKIAAPTVLVREKRSAKREFLDLRRRKTAAEAIAELTLGNEIYGFTKGQFSLLDMLKALVEKTGPCHLVLSTWTAASKEIDELASLMTSGALLSTRWLIDYTFVRRDRSAAACIRERFGMDSMRVANTHSKFAVFSNDAWQLVLRSSMNLNMNPRFEDFTLGNDPELSAFLLGIIDEIFAKQKRDFGDKAKPGEQRRFFLDEM